VSTALGQINTATVTGLVSDATHAIIPGAQVQITNEGMGVVKTAVSNPEGRYTFTFLLPGTYDLSVQARGFGTFERKGVSVQAAQVLNLDCELEVGAAAQSVTVSGQSQLLNVATSHQIETVTNMELTGLPQPRLDWASLMSLGTGMTNLGTSIGGAGTILMNGLSPTSMSITVDGTNGSTFPEVPAFGFYGQPNIINTLNEDAISEVSVVKGIVPASVGGTVSGNVNLITKSGTNQFHGSAFELNDVAAYNARNQFLAAKPGSTFNQYGGSLGGPILKDKLFFFGSYEGVRFSQLANITGQAPTPYLLSISPKPYADNLALYPKVYQPTDPAAVVALWSGVGSAVNNDANTAVRGDYFISPSNQLTVRYTRSTPYKLIPRFVTVNDQTYDAASNMINVNFVHTTGSFTSSTRFGYNKLYQLRVDQGFKIGLEGLSFSGIGNGGSEYYELNGGTYTAINDVTISRGHHLIQFGGIFQRLNSSRLDLNTANFSYSTLSDFQNNIPSSVSITFDVPTSILHTYQFGASLQDDYKLAPNLTLNLGVRYDVFTVPKERDGRIFNRGVDPNRPQLGYGYGPYRPPSSIFNGDFNNVQPRVGFAWSLGSKRKTVVRGGFGVFVAPRPLFAGIAPLMAAGPNIPFRSTTNRNTNLAAGLGYPIVRDQFIPTLQNLVSGGFLSSQIASFSPVATNNPDPYSMQWMFGVERELGYGIVLTVNYVGNRGLKMTMNYYGNLPDRITGLAADPNYARFLLSVPVDASTYEGLQTSVSKRFSGGLMFNVNYTYSSNRAICVGDATNWGNCYPQDLNNFRADIGPTNFNLPHNFNESVVYQLPFTRWFGMRGGAAKMLTDGWQISEIFTGTSGLPLNISDGSSTYNDSRPDLVAGVNAINGNYRSTLQYLNPAAFAKIPIIAASGASARPGSLGRNVFSLPAVWNVNASLAKSFAIRETVRFQLRGDFLNAFNETNLSGLQTNISSGSFGKFSSAIARTVQVGARLSF
jgi:hypothetical protein